MFIKLYRRYFQNRFFNRMFILYSAIAIISIIVIACLAAQNLAATLERREAESNRQVFNGISGCLDQQLNTARNIIQQVTLNNALHTEIMFLIKYGYTRHLEYKLEQFSASRSTSYNGFEQSFYSILANSGDIESIAIYSPQLDQVFIYQNELRIINPALFFSPFALPEVYHRKVLPVHNAGHSPANLNQRVYTILYPLNDAVSQTKEFGPGETGGSFGAVSSWGAGGLLAINYDLAGLERVYAKYAGNFNGRATVYTAEGQMVFDSTGRYDPKGRAPVADLRQLQNLQKQARPSSTGFKNRDIVNYASFENTGMMAVTVTPRRLFEIKARQTTRTILFLALAGIGGTILFTAFTMTAFTKRVSRLQNGIKKITAGELDARIPLGRETDELNEIAAGFNSMCDELNLYIQQVYVAGLKQKSAELKAFQAQINPHFLYNTLEAIRMRAVSQGAGDAARMIYLLAELFRHAVKGAMSVSIREELKSAQMYLELFNIRHQNQLTVIYEVQEELLEFAMIKHTLQPLVENYLRHGFIPSNPGNQITLTISRTGADILITVADNGRGIPTEKLIKLNQALANPESQPDQGLGLVNVNERLKIIFGSAYGLAITGAPGQGTTVTLKIPARTREEVQSHVQSPDRG